jgi:spore coat-associated protein N
LSRFAYLIAHPRRTLAALATVLVAGSLTAASGADFTAQAANPLNTFTAGTLTIDDSRDAAAILSADDMRPGDDFAEGTVDIANSGSLSGDFSLTRGAIDDADAVHPLSERIAMVVRDCGAFAGATPPTCEDGDTLVYDGPLSAMPADLDLGAFAAGERHRFRFQTRLDPSAGNAYQGGSAEVTFTWTAA